MRPPLAVGGSASGVAGATASSSGASATNGNGGVLGATGASGRSGTLPLTGLPIWVFVLVGGLMIGTGLVLRRSARQT